MQQEEESSDEKHAHHSLFKDLILGHRKQKSSKTYISHAADSSVSSSNEVSVEGSRHGLAHLPFLGHSGHPGTHQIISPMMKAMNPLHTPPLLSLSPLMEGTAEVALLSPPIDMRLSVTTPQKHKNLSRQNSDQNLSQKYGKKFTTIGKGSTATIKLCSITNSPNEKKYAVKEFKKRSHNENQKGYVKRMMGEFCVASALDHENVVKTFDLIQDDVCTYSFGMIV
jgi:Protein kinase domain